VGWPLLVPQRLSSQEAMSLRGEQGEVVRGGVGVLREVRR